MNTEIVSATVLVPREKVPELYELSSSWIRERDKPWVDEADELGQSTDHQLHQATQLYIRSSERGEGGIAREFLDLLMEHPGEKFSGDDLLAAFGIQTEAGKGRARLSGALSPIGRHASALGKDLPYEYDRDTNQYWMTDAIHHLFRQARRDYEVSGDELNAYSDIEDDLDTMLSERHPNAARFIATRRSRQLWKDIYALRKARGELEPHWPVEEEEKMER